ncbi:hypothetical protein H310_02355 [Aphanomyces invadans]|uniref:J domain-containing protein n=1 Tax=Aphanomyces invadans TaxID=157072 RepID=A0A024UNW0_9STRA|nr:hypothetical protein H310_02355 [Aphanomyces invadans]ETW07969.1 hypothetical protein H310_02355 [Aphanomyces invadans]|eukprot:XP_008864062.1 hypothetical protein H310_02355 [Aphanomyces invadans]
MMEWRRIYRWALLVYYLGSESVKAVAQDDAVLACTVRAPQYLSIEHKAALCAGVHLDTATAPADCACELKLHLGTATSSEIALTLCSGATSVGPATCFRTVNAFSFTILPMPQLLTLCRGVADEENALCFHHLHRKLQLDVNSIVLLCTQPNAWSYVDEIVSCFQRHTTLASTTRLRLCMKPSLISDATLACLQTLSHRYTLASDRDDLFPLCLSRSPHHALSCVEAAPWGYTVSFKTALCINATGVGPAECLKGLMGASTWTNDDKLSLCSGATSSKRIDCVLKLSSRYSIRQKVALCAHDHDTPLRCTRTIKGLPPTGDEIAICGRASSLGPAECFNVDTGLSTALKVELCANGGNRDRAQCVLRLRSMLHSFTAHDLVQLCAAVTTPDELPSLMQCLTTGFRAVLAARDVIHVCKGASSAAPARCLQEHLAGWSSSEKAALCYSATDLSPVDCIRRLGPTTLLQRRHQVQLCVGATAPVFPAICAKSAPPRFVHPVDRVRLCAQASTSFPLDCAASLPSTHPSVVAAVCSQVASLAPAECIQAALRSGSKLTQSVIARCRSVSSFPAMLSLASVIKECPVLVPHCPVTIELHVLDQFGHRMLTYGLHPSAGSIDSNHSMRLTAAFQSQPCLALGKREPVVDGRSTFRMAFPHAGHFRLVLALANITVLHLPVHVQEDPGAVAWTASCDRIFRSHLQCIPSSATFPSYQFLQVDAVANTLLAVVCAGTLELLEPLSPSLSTSARAIAAAPWLPYHMHLQVPLSPWEVLRIPDNATLDVVRAAYRHQSLVYHPDRSAAAAATYFDSVRSAYEAAVHLDDQNRSIRVDK